ncbi:hypothetical protein [Bradyrhizobium sp. 192]|nr:hypothetical protein [Bradyrhizobium sp. 192]UPJ55096.1 hypothetical protein IVB24_20605 [Bradyrhizobium sp. 192]
MRLCVARNITQFSREIYCDKLPRPEKVILQNPAMSLGLPKNKRRKVTS